MRFAIMLPLALFAAASPAHAQEVFGGIYKHAVDTPLSLGGGGERGLDLQLGYRFDGIGGTRLQPYAFGSLNTAGDTSFAAAGLSYRFGQRLYVRPGLGIAIHNGSARDYEVPGNGKIEFGNRVLFEPELAIGFQANERVGIEASWVHLSHAQLFGKQNPGMDDVGVRVNWRL